ncbi:hypothetical protein WJX72_006358 [[Myrmecia] bisecta]|uniref:Uncharacterized protein n=1 Tax=[Myrmecia] bisecta TaxID=41462 RepID=A0AAW1PLF1_9CHLO
MRKQRAANIQALLSNRLETNRQPMLPRLLSVQGAEAVLRKAFKSPHPSAPSVSLAADEPEVKPLILWDVPDGQEGKPVAVDPMLTKWLRPHQREGVQFMFECVCGLREYEGQGCILADDMGLGKTLQGITLLWTLLKSGHELLGGEPIAKRIIIVCPTSLVSNWDSECDKWLKGRVKTLPLCESSRDDVIQSVSQFLSPRNPYQVLIVSYETFRLHAAKFTGEHACDLLICDEAHRLKNDQTLTNKALDSLDCKRRVLLSGTPMQNHLDEFYAMVSFCNPNVLGSPSAFRREFEGPILAGREPDATAEVAELGAERSSELSAIVNQFILRRTNALLSAHLPPKVVEVVCCKMTELQRSLYCHFLASNAAAKLLTGKKAARVLSAITALKKLCNHPKLIYDVINAPFNQGGGGVDGFEDCGQFFPPGLFDDGRPGRGSMPLGWEALSGKFCVLAKMLAKLRADTDDRIVIVSNYTQTLDLFAQLCRERQYPFLRLDGTTTITKRQKLVKQFNDLEQRQFVFLLSSKAGGCGLNLVGGNRLVLFDPDWNPANDKQAAARVWRDGQMKRVYVYRFLTTGTIEEKVYQRQLSKEGLQSVVNKTDEAGGAGGSNMMSTEELRDLFTLRPDTLSDTFDSMCSRQEAEEAPHDQEAERRASHESASSSGCEQADPGRQAVHRAQVGAPAEEDLKSWGQHSSTATVPDAVMQHIGDEQVSFVFSCQVEGKPLDNEPIIPALAAGQAVKASSSAASRQPLGQLSNTSMERQKAAGMESGASKRPRVEPSVKPTRPKPVFMSDSDDDFV